MKSIAERFFFFFFQFELHRESCSNAHKLNMVNREDTDGAEVYKEIHHCTCCNYVIYISG